MAQDSVITVNQPLAPGTYTATLTPVAAPPVAPPIVVPPPPPPPTTGGKADIWEHTFDDGTFGALRTGGSRTLDTIGWVIDPLTSARGSRSLRHNVPVLNSNQAFNAYYSLPLPRSSAYIRFAYRQSAGFDNASPIKVLRVQKDFGQLLGSVIFNGDGPNVITVHGESRVPSNQHCNLSAPSPDSLRGQWHWYEFFLDVSLQNQTIYRLWVDDKLAMDRTLTHAAVSVNDFNQIFIGGTLNRIAVNGTIHYDHIGISTTKMGIP